jgi:hypothetical protein
MSSHRGNMCTALNQELLVGKPVDKTWVESISWNLLENTWWEINPRGGRETVLNHRCTSEASGKM